MAFPDRSVSFPLALNKQRAHIFAEGVITVAAGIAGLYVLPDFPYAFKQKWLKPEEARFITLRSKYHAGRASIVASLTLVLISACSESS